MSKRREKPFRRQAIDDAQEEKEDRQSSYWVRDTSDKSAHSIVRKKAPMTNGIFFLLAAA